MHRVRALVIVAAIVGATLSLSAPAQAGGPTSVILSVPDGGQTASLYYTDPEYDALAAMLGADIGDGTSMADTSGRSHATGPGVTVTWLIHDVTPWRVDHVYLLGEGAPWVATQLSDESGTIGNSPVIWHKPASPAKLVALLDQLGVGATSPASNTFGGVEGSSLSDEATPVAGPKAAPVAESSALAGIWWAVGGVAAGVLLTMVWKRGRHTEADLPTDDFETDGLAEELTWPAVRS